MKRFWFEFAFKSDEFVPGGFKLGCGVTAYSETEALEIIKRKAFENATLPRISKVIENVDVSLLDPNHVLPNMNPPNIRGIWFPLGY